MRALLSICFGLLAMASFAQSGALSGRVIDEAQLPLPGATVSVEGLRMTVTDADGFYSILDLPAGNHTLTITYIGFETLSESVMITEGVTTNQTYALKPGVSLSEIVVTSRLRGQARALSQQQSNYNITNIIAADQIGRFPDANIGDALKRVPGISVQYDQGEARFGSIRGTAPQLNAVTINGERIPSAEAEIRTIQLDLIPSDMIQTIEVNKAVTPDMDADAIGGSVNLVTRAAPYQQRLSATVGGGYNALVQEPSFNGALIYGNRFANDKLGLILSASYFDNQLGSDNVEACWTFDDANDNDLFDEGESVFPEEIQIRQYTLQRIRQSYSIGLDYQINPNHTLLLKGIYNQRSDWENRYRAVFKDIEQDGDQWVAELERQTKGGNPDTKFARLEDQEMYSFQLGGNHLFGGLRMDWSATYAAASEDRPNERYFEYATDGTVPVNVDFSNPDEPLIAATDADFSRPSRFWELNELTEEFQYTEDVDFNARLDFTVPLSTGNNQNFVKFGARLRTKSKLRSNDFFEYEPTSSMTFDNSLANLNDLSKDDFLAGAYLAGQFVSPEFLGDLDLTSSEFEGERDPSELAGNFDAEETILSGYAMLQQQLGTDFLLVAGLRLEQTNQTYEGFRFDDDEGTLDPTPQVESDYLNVLPGLHLRYNFTPSTLLRFAWTNTLARPNYFDLVPYREIADGEDLSIGNPDLQATTSMNFDLMVEHYFGNVGIVSGGIFFKDIDDFTVAQTFANFEFEGTEWNSFTQPINGGNASLYGFELAFQRQLDFISPGFGLYFNYTFTESEVTDFNFEGREDEELALPGSPKHTLNASIAYETSRFTSRLSLNYASDFVDEVGSSDFFDRYYDEVTYLDLNLGFAINDRFNIYANVNNLLNQPLRYYQGIPSRTMQAEFYDVRFDFGIKFDLLR